MSVKMSKQNIKYCNETGESSNETLGHVEALATNFTTLKPHCVLWAGV